MELEQKYLVRDEEALSEARLLLSTLALAEGPECGVQHDVYYDTRDLSLLHRGASLRVRRKGTRYKLTIKGGGGRTDGRFCRTEQEFPLRLPDPELCRSAILSAFPDLPADCGFRPVAWVENQRTTLLLDASVEAALDRVTYPPSGGRELQLELEVTGSGGEALLDRLVQALRSVPGLTPMTESKYERAMSRRDAACRQRSFL